VLGFLCFFLFAVEKERSGKKIKREEDQAAISFELFHNTNQLLMRQLPNDSQNTCGWRPRTARTANFSAGKCEGRVKKNLKLAFVVGFLCFFLFAVEKERS
jgi:hypothetical protein